MAWTTPGWSRGSTTTASPSSAGGALRRRAPARGGRRRAGRAGAVVVAAGSSADIPPSTAWRREALDQPEATTAREVPARLAILGGGVVGVEMAQAWTTLGSKVTLVEGGPRLIAREEPFASEDVRSSRGAAWMCARAPQAYGVRAEGGEVELTLDDGGSIGDELLVAVGRRPRTDELGRDGRAEAGRDDRGRRPAAGERLALRVGDVNGRALLTHMGKYQARIAADVILGKESASSATAPLAAGDLHRAARGRGWATRSSSARRGAERARRGRADRRRPGPASTAATTRREPAGSWSTRIGA